MSVIALSIEDFKLKHAVVIHARGGIDNHLMAIQLQLTIRIQITAEIVIPIQQIPQFGATQQIPQKDGTIVILLLINIKLAKMILSKSNW